LLTSTQTQREKKGETRKKEGETRKKRDRDGNGVEI
jgi:hypothetical protein